MAQRTDVSKEVSSPSLEEDAADGTAWTAASWAVTSRPEVTTLWKTRYHLEASETMPFKKRHAYLLHIIYTLLAKVSV